MNSKESKPPKRIVAGVMSGTSCDGVDVALVRFTTAASHHLPQKGTLIDFATVPYSHSLRGDLLQHVNLNTQSKDIVLEERVAERLQQAWFCAVDELICKNNCQHELFAIGSHGQTLVHAPEHGRTFQWDCLPDWQRRFVCHIVGNVRQADMGAGGQGAPLAPLLHACFVQRASNNVFVNFGGMANLTYVPAWHRNPDCSNNQEAYIDWCAGVMGWDTGPGNVFMDYFVEHHSKGQQHYDRDGSWASRGQVDEDYVQQFIISESYFGLKPPKSTGRDRFGAVAAKKMLGDLSGHSVYDQLATVTEITVRTFVDSLREKVLAPELTVWICGGGAHNSYLVRRIAAYGNLQVKTVTHADALEAWLMALIADRSLAGLPSNIPSVTGAGRLVCLGDVLQNR